MILAIKAHPDELSDEALDARASELARHASTMDVGSEEHDRALAEWWPYFVASLERKKRRNA